MKQTKEILRVFEKYTPEIEAEIRQLLEAQNSLALYDMMAYFFGFLDESLKPTVYYGGKRFRPGICMLLSDFYGCRNEALEASTAIEIFHNFTLIHDDIADRDEVRRDRPTVWKKWGLNQALNTGDAQLILVAAELDKFVAKNPGRYHQIQAYINKKFLEVTEGQYLDFWLSELEIGDARITEEKIFEMMSKKSGVLVGLPAAVAGMVAGKTEEEVSNLWEYGFNLGVTYQYCDDIVSIWGNKESSGKDEMADIREKKKTVPVAYLYNSADQDTKRRLTELYNKQEDLTVDEIKEVKSMLDNAGAKEYITARGKETLQKVIDSVELLSITREQKDVLLQINQALFAPIYECGEV